MEHGTCELCQKKDELCDSHIVPKFVRKYMVQTSGRIRDFQNPNKTVQDIPKQYLLCSACEGRFNTRETPFNLEVFRPYQKTSEIKSPIMYEDWLEYFIVSVNWRIAVTGINHIIEDDCEAQTLLTSIKEDWRKYLIGEAPLPSYSEQHIYFAQELDSLFPEQVALKEPVDTYIKRILHMGMESDDSKNLIFFAKLPGILLVSFVGDNERGSNGTKVSTTGSITSSIQRLGERSKALLSKYISNFTQLQKQNEGILTERTLERAAQLFGGKSIEELLLNEDFLAMIKDAHIPIILK